ncbi:hypothetical protein AURDEDRAFT_124978 [Auricularia subglabra TFB-10046 SS5]|nr:hypothetical protein AURDEDRAFT_124978 [Auricularia subglabra TFB-10046 SS5]
MYITGAPRECGPFRLYYSIDRGGDPPSDLVLPDAAAISFLTPDADLTEWMVLRPPMGTGILTWTCTLRSGKQFVVRNGSGFKQVFTVGTASSDAPCGQNATSVITSSTYGSLDARAYNALTAQNYVPMSISPANQFSSHAMPSTAGLKVDTINLGAALFASPSTTHVVTQARDQGGAPTAASISKLPSDDSPSTTLSGSSGAANLETPIAAQRSTSHATSAPSGTIVNPGQELPSASSTEGSKQGPELSEPPDHSGAHTKTLVAVIVIAIFVVGFLSAAVLFHTRRRARRKAVPSVNAIPAVRLSDVSFESGYPQFNAPASYTLHRFLGYIESCLGPRSRTNTMSGKKTSAQSPRVHGGYDGRAEQAPEHVILQNESTVRAGERRRTAAVTLAPWPGVKSRQMDWCAFISAVTDQPAVVAQCSVRYLYQSAVGGTGALMKLKTIGATRLVRPAVQPKTTTDVEMTLMHIGTRRTRVFSSGNAGAMRAPRVPPNRANSRSRVRPVASGPSAAPTPREMAPQPSENGFQSE